ncbi:zeta toxin family protein [Kibdelosporangium philippinense]|uniref:UDP-N-acetylglucosamine kinase n=1 Tax=Kibdelosporangium philippinense TaxID=211113 RepID=A0ABS8ZVV4_9PSEU|nr:AAA family ATPase [Kibdelosporangium philippinense]MCE7011737.1 zeta toxin family protein [Kibdelosporangium philippinense]
MEVAASDAIPRSRPRLIVLRGNSGAGKSTVARELRAELGRGVAIVDQDTIRRKLLREHDVECGVNIGLIEQIVHYTLANDYVVILEGILHAGRYGEMLRRLHRDFGGGWYFLQVTWDESLRRHQTRQQRAEFTPEQMREFPRAGLLEGVDERIVPEHSAAADTVRRILTENFPHHSPASSTRSRVNLS